MSQKITIEELQKHNSHEDAWIAVKGRVYNVTKFAALHPGGKKILLDAAGTDATTLFDNYHRATLLLKYNNLVIGELEGEKPPKSLFEKSVPFGDPAWAQGIPNPFYNESHKKYKVAVREWVETNLTPYVQEWEATKNPPQDLQKRCYEAGILPAVVGGTWPTKFVGSNICGGVKPEEWDVFHNAIMVDELQRCGSGGVVTYLIGGLSIGIGTVFHFANQQLKERVVGPCLKGEKKIDLAITEPSAGSDVANLKCTAKLTPDGKHYIVNGEKKWISTGVFADFHTTAVRTGGPGMGGISLLLLEKGMPGIKTRVMNVQGLWGSGTTYLIFEDVKVPVENLIGKEGAGFKMMMYNFNPERMGIISQAIRSARLCYEEAYKYAHKRKTFGQRLIDSPVIRAKIGNMIRQIETVQSYMEHTLYAMNQLGHMKSMEMLSGQIAFLKVQASTVFEYCAREAVQIFGGLGYTQGGVGGVVERLYREVRAMAILGGR
jgi:alkylation response protein AidB-like acyl-CoA dehydrogenase/predicted heme/steroid binding protein